jgi:hypothetical protein
MDGTARGGGEFDETVVFLSYFNDLTDPRQRGKVTYPPVTASTGEGLITMQEATGALSVTRQTLH